MARDLVTPGPDRNSHSQGALDGAKSSRVGLVQSVELAENAGRARAISAVFTPFAIGGGSHDVVVLRRDGMLAHYHIDANNGSFIGVTDQKVASLMTSLTPDAGGAAKLSLRDAVSIIESRAPERRAIGAAAEQSGTTIEYEITVATADGDKSFHVSSNGDVSE
ncbi:hypothetical protein [Chenggangzhangella methanolivorans]|uniref:PepSY domain-containing protein n=1 Tax=Chenggangzhangella methanolivorans TaxID=1437009 RepID=A0A9E6UNX3_9HYPH|nr:hypothetical protein [Chenggangzhangella methanolivorans]QZN99074.1 hypothetical protein K6K41_19785 [Chenggangzhangella methanolivorans]